MKKEEVISNSKLVEWETRAQLQEIHLKEEQVSPAWFDKLCEKTPKTIFNIAAGRRNELLNRALEKAIGQLSPNQRKIIHFIFWEGLSEQEIANATKIPRTTISNRKYAAFLSLREKVGPNFLYYEGTNSKISNPKLESWQLNACIPEQKMNGERSE